MNINEAIRRLQDRAIGEFSDNDPENLDDIKLGIEALALLERCRKKAEIQVFPMLPSETE